MAPINNTWPEAIFVYFTRSSYIVYKIFNMIMHYPQWNYITVPSFVFRCVTISELRLFKQKKKKKKKRKMKNLQNGLFVNLTPLSSIKLYHFIITVSFWV